MLRTVTCRGCTLLRTSLRRGGGTTSSSLYLRAASSTMGTGSGTARIRGLASVAPSRSEPEEVTTTPTTTSTSPEASTAPSSADASKEGEVSTPTGTRLSNRRARIAPIKLTDRAADRIKELLEGREKIVGVRLGIKRRGCNGLSYTMNYAEDKPKFDEEVSERGVRVFIDPMALMHIVGTVMDFEETELSSEFTFNNPNAKGKCGCGESFSV